MSLDLGTLSGKLALDGSSFDKTLDSLPGKFKGSGVALGVAAGLVGALIGGAISQGIDQGVQLDAAQHTITAQLGLTEEESARIGGVAGKLYAQAYGESIEDVNKSVQDVVSSIDGMRGATETALADMTAKALNFGSAFEVDTARSTQVVGQLIKSGLVKDANEGFDLLTATFQKVPAAVREDILDAADEYGPFFQQIGLRGEEAFGLLAKGAEKGMYGIDKAGDAVKEFTIRSTDMSAASKVGYDILGMSQEDATRKILAGGESASDAFNEIVLGLKRIEDPAAQSQAALALFGTPLEDLGTSQIPTFLESLQATDSGLGDVAGAADRMGESLNGSVKVGWEQLSRTWDGIIGQVGTALVPILGTIAGILNENPAILQAVALALGVLAIAFVGVTVATWAMNTALLANPITWIILGIVALIAALVFLVLNWDTVVASISTIWGGFIGWVSDGLNAFNAWWGGLWKGIFEGLAAGWNWVVGLVVGIVTGYINLQISLFMGFLNFWVGLWNTVSSIFTTAWNNAVSFVSGIPGAIMGVFAGIGSWLYNAGRDLINGLLSGIRSLAGTIGSFFLNLLPGWIVAPFKMALGIASPSKVFRGFGRNIGEGLLGGLDDIQPEIDTRMGDLVGVAAAPASSSSDATMVRSSAAPRQAILDLRGAHVGWMPDKVADRLNEWDEQAVEKYGNDTGQVP